MGKARISLNSTLGDWPRGSAERHRIETDPIRRTRMLTTITRRRETRLTEADIGGPHHRAIVVRFANPGASLVRARPDATVPATELLRSRCHPALPAGVRVVPGIYFVRVEAGSSQAVTKV